MRDVLSLPIMPFEIVTADMKGGSRPYECLSIGLAWLDPTYDESSNKITEYKFANFTESVKKAIAKPIKPERTQDVKRFFDSSNTLRDDGSKYY